VAWWLEWIPDCGFYEVYGAMKLNNMTLDKIKILAEVLAFLSIAFFFIYKNAAGGQGVSLSVNISTERVGDPCDKSKDILGVIVKIKNGANSGTVRLSDAVAAFKYDKVTLENRLEGLIRYEIENGKVILGKQSKEKPWTGLGPAEEIQLSTYASVAKGSVCIVDVTILARKFMHKKSNESRSTAVSMPIED
jgi:hypothetical protein